MTAASHERLVRGSSIPPRNQLHVHGGSVCVAGTLRVDHQLFDDTSQPRAFTLTRSAVSPSGLIHATYVRGGDVKTATVGGAGVPSHAELARREKLQREG